MLSLCRLRLARRTVFGAAVLLAACLSAGQATYGAYSATFPEGSYVSGSSSNLVSNDGSKLVMNSAPDGLGNQVASARILYPIPLDVAPARVVFGATLSQGGQPVDGYVQIYVKGSGSQPDLYLGYRYTNSGAVADSLPISRQQELDYRDANGRLNILYRAFRTSSPAVGNTSAFSFGADQLVVQENTFYDVPFTNGGHYNFLVRASQPERVATEWAYDIGDIPNDVYQFLQNLNAPYWTFGKDFASRPNLLDDQLYLSTFATSTGPTYKGLVAGINQGYMSTTFSAQWELPTAFLPGGGSATYADNGHDYWIVVVKRGFHGLQLLSHSGTPSYYGLGSGGEDDTYSNVQPSQQTNGVPPLCAKYIHVVDSIEDEIGQSVIGPSIVPFKYYVMLCTYSYDPQSPYIGVTILDAVEVSGNVCGRNQQTTPPAP